MVKIGSVIGLGQTPWERKSVQRKLLMYLAHNTIRGAGQFRHLQDFMATQPREGLGDSSDMLA